MNDARSAGCLQFTFKTLPIVALLMCVDEFQTFPQHEIDCRLLTATKYKERLDILIISETIETFFYFTFA